MNLISSLLLFLFALTSDPKPVGTTYYISASGSDAADGLSPATAWKTTAKVNSVIKQPGDRFLFHAGDTFPGKIRIRQSGTGAHPIVFSGYGTGAKPVITGLVKPASWSNQGANVWQATVHSESVLNLVTVTGRPVARGRFPNVTDPAEGNLTYEFHTAYSHIVDANYNSTKYGPMQNWVGAWISMRTTTWMWNTFPVIAQAGGDFTYAGPVDTMAQEPTNGGGYFIQNDPRTLDQQNEWYWNPSTQVLSFFSTTNPGSLGVQAAYIDTLLKGTVVSNITLNGLSFAGSNRQTVFFYKGDHIKVLNCNLNQNGLNGIQTDQTTQVTFTGDSVLYSNNNAVGITPFCAQSLVSDSYVYSSGMLAGMGTSGNVQYTGLVMHGHGSSCINTTVRCTGYNGIVTFEDTIAVRHCLVDSFCMRLDDGAGIYTSGHGVERYIVGNTVMNGIGNPYGSYEASGLANGIGCDDYTENVLIDSNTVYNIVREGVGLHNSRNVKVTNNLFYGCGLRAIGMGHDRNGADNPLRNIVIKKNYFISTSSLPSQYLNQYSYAVNALWVYETRRGREDILAFGTSDSNYYLKPRAPYPSNDFIKYSFQELPAGTKVTHSGGGPTTAADTDAVSVRRWRTSTLKDWQQYSGQDLHSREGTFVYPALTVNSVGAEWFQGGSFEQAANHVQNPNNTQTAYSWDNTAQMNGTGSLKVTYTGPAPSGGSFQIWFNDYPANIQTLLPGHTYRVQFAIKSNSATTADFQAWFMGDSLRETQRQIIKVTSRKQKYELYFTPKVRIPTHYFKLQCDDASTAPVWWVDDFHVNEVSVTPTNPADFMRLALNSGKSPVQYIANKAYVDHLGRAVGTKKQLAAGKYQMLFTLPAAQQAGKEKARAGSNK